MKMKEIGPGARVLALPPPWIRLHDGFVTWPSSGSDTHLATDIRPKNGYSNDLFTLPHSDSDLDSDYCTMQKFPFGSDSDSDPLIEMK